MLKGRCWPGLALAGFALACSHKRAPSLDPDFLPVRDAGPDGSFFHVVPPGPPAADASGYCGNTIVPIVTERPNLYFILDASDSMSTPMDTLDANGKASTRYGASLAAIEALLSVVGHRVSYGAATFPTPPKAGQIACGAGGEVFSTRPGDPFGGPGTTLNALVRTLAGRTPSGGTPTAATLGVLEPTLTALVGKTYAFLLTDGAPNCDPAASCTVAECTTNIEGDCDPKDPTVNCCDPSVVSHGNLDCLDANPTVVAVASLYAKGVETFVVGMPGTSPYAQLLDRVATVGGTARSSEPLYYPVQNSDDLAATLKQIGLSVAIQCEVDLGTKPPDETLVNVYFDKTVVPFDAANGWTWATVDGGDVGDTGDGGHGAAKISIVGQACAELQAGDVGQVQVVSGCPSFVQ